LQLTEYAFYLHETVEDCFYHIHFAPFRRGYWISFKKNMTKFISAFFIAIGAYLYILLWVVPSIIVVVVGVAILIKKHIALKGGE
jgi:hypothetical protein